eukprot:MONOS_7713.1-p1 / transcript=MONOS_7713.1 / gene=MONOS_7713 / organism=Monocercomonoides_exilis_PA203 / gene_product=WD domain containing protein / transcript_product=WD domain containing protein / location=Mono_scaffold00271:467-5830(-) / protein_length=1788 / sequence_SO=supercontig / SO=protein_coding / is_pseudo=false
MLSTEEVKSMRFFSLSPFLLPPLIPHSSPFDCCPSANILTHYDEEKNSLTEPTENNNISPLHSGFSTIEQTIRPSSSLCSTSFSSTASLSNNNSNDNFNKCHNIKKNNVNGQSIRSHNYHSVIHFYSLTTGALIRTVCPSTQSSLDFSENCNDKTETNSSSASNSNSVTCYSTSFCQANDPSFSFDNNFVSTNPVELFAPELFSELFGHVETELESQNAGQQFNTSIPLSSHNKQDNSLYSSSSFLPYFAVSAPNSPLPQNSETNNSQKSSSDSFSHHIPPSCPPSPPSPSLFFPSLFLPSTSSSPPVADSLKVSPLFLSFLFSRGFELNNPFFSRLFQRKFDLLSGILDILKGDSRFLVQAEEKGEKGNGVDNEEKAGNLIELIRRMRKEEERRKGNKGEEQKGDDEEGNDKMQREMEKVCSKNENFKCCNNFRNEDLIENEQFKSQNSFTLHKNNTFSSKTHQHRIFNSCEARSKSRSLNNLLKAASLKDDNFPSSSTSAASSFFSDLSRLTTFVFKAPKRDRTFKPFVSSVFSYSSHELSTHDGGSVENITWTLSNLLPSPLPNAARWKKLSIFQKENVSSPSSCSLSPGLNAFRPQKIPNCQSKQIISEQTSSYPTLNSDHLPSYLHSPSSSSPPPSSSSSSSSSPSKNCTLTLPSVPPLRILHISLPSSDLSEVIVLPFLVLDIVGVCSILSSYSTLEIHKIRMEETRNCYKMAKIEDLKREREREIERKRIMEGNQFSTEGEYDTQGNSEDTEDDDISFGNSRSSISSNLSFNLAPTTNTFALNGVPVSCSSLSEQREYSSSDIVSGEMRNKNLIIKEELTKKNKHMKRNAMRNEPRSGRTARQTSKVHMRSSRNSSSSSSLTPPSLQSSPSPSFLRSLSKSHSKSKTHEQPKRGDSEVQSVKSVQSTHSLSSSESSSLCLPPNKLENEPFFQSSAFSVSLDTFNNAWNKKPENIKQRGTKSLKLNRIPENEKEGFELSCECTTKIARKLKQGSTNRMPHVSSSASNLSSFSPNFPVDKSHIHSASHFSSSTSPSPSPSYLESHLSPSSVPPCISGLLPLYLDPSEALSRLLLSLVPFFLPFGFSNRVDSDIIKHFSLPGSPCLGIGYLIGNATTQGISITLPAASYGVNALSHTPALSTTITIAGIAMITSLMNATGFISEEYEREWKRFCVRQIQILYKMVPATSIRQYVPPSLPHTSLLASSNYVSDCVYHAHRALLASIISRGSREEKAFAAFVCSSLLPDVPALIVDEKGKGKKKGKVRSKPVLKDFPNNFSSSDSDLISSKFRHSSLTISTLNKQFFDQYSNVQAQMSDSLSPEEAAAAVNDDDLLIAQILTRIGVVDPDVMEGRLVRPLLNMIILLIKHGDSTKAIIAIDLLVDGCSFFRTFISRSQFKILLTTLFTHSLERQSKFQESYLGTEERCKTHTKQTKTNGTSSNALFVPVPLKEIEEESGCYVSTPGEDGSDLINEKCSSGNGCVPMDSEFSEIDEVFEPEMADMSSDSSLEDFADTGPMTDISFEATPLAQAALRAFFELGRPDPQLMLSCLSDILESYKGEVVETQLPKAKQVLNVLMTWFQETPSSWDVVGHIPLLFSIVCKLLDPQFRFVRQAVNETASVFVSRILEKYPMAAFNNATHRFAIGRLDGCIEISSAQQLEKEKTIVAHKGAIAAVAFSDNGKFLASYSEGDHCVKVWKCEMNFLHVFLRTESPVKSFVVPPANPLVLKTAVIVEALLKWEGKQICLRRADVPFGEREKNYLSNTRSLSFAEDPIFVQFKFFAD